MRARDGDGIDEIGAGDSAITVSPQSNGKRGAPFAIGSTVRYHDTSEITVLGVNPNGTEAILARSELNDPPADGEHYVIVTLRVTNLGDDIDSSDSSVSGRSGRPRSSMGNLMTIAVWCRMH